MSVHHMLEKKYRWYRNWHKKPYANLVHFVIVIVLAAYTIYLALEVQQYVLFLTTI
jgi:hypothetical protein